MSQKKGKVYSGIKDLPRGIASDSITPGCLVVEGGAFRGLYVEGVLDLLMEEDVNLACTIGVSAGATSGMHYVSGQIGRAARFNLIYRHDPRYVGRIALRDNQGIMGFDFFYNEFGAKHPFNYKRFNQPERRFIAVATSCLTGETLYFEKGKCSDIEKAIQASATMPYVSKPVMVDGIPCMDGGCTVKVPYRWALKQGFEKIVVIRSREPWHRRKENTPESRLAKIVYRQYPEFAKQLATSPARANAECDELDRLQKEGRIFLIAPRLPVDIKRLEGDMEKLGELYYRGRGDAQKLLPDLKEYLGIE